MDLGIAKCHRKATMNWFHHDQSFHRDHGLVWHDGKRVYLSDLQFSSIKMPKALSAPLILGEFDNVEGVWWSRAKSFVNSFVCVQHTDYISIWAVSGRSPNLKCQKQTENRVKSFPQGCLWHPYSPVLCVLSDRVIHMYNAHTKHWDTVPSDERISAGCWVMDGSKFILAVGTEVKVYSFNLQEHTLYPGGPLMKSAASYSLNPNMRIKTMVTVANDLVAIATDLPLEHLVCQSRQNLLDIATMTEAHLEPTVTTHTPTTSAFSLKIPKKCIVPNPVADFLKDNPATNQTTSKGNTSTKNVVNSSASVGTEEERGAPNSEPFEDKLDQIITLMTRMDGMPDIRKRHIDKGKKQDLCHEVEFTVQDASRSRPIDITAMMSDSVTVRSAGKHKAQKIPSDNSSLKQLKQGKSGIDMPITSGININLLITDLEQTSRSNTSSEHQPNSEQATNEDTENAGKERVSSHTTRELSKLIESEIQGRQSGPIDVTSLLAAKSSERTRKQQKSASQSKLKVADDDEDCMEENNKIIMDSQQKSDDVIDLRRLPANVQTQANLLQALELKYEKGDVSDTAKLTVLRVSAFTEPVTVCSVDLPGILTPDLLYYQTATQSFIVGTNTQRLLLSYTLQDNTLVAAEQKIMLPDSYRPLGICSIPTYPTGILVLAGQSRSSTIDSAFLLFSSEMQLDLKLFSYQLQLCISHTDAANITDDNNSADNSSLYPSILPRTSMINFLSEDAAELSTNTTPIKCEVVSETDAQDSPNENMFCSFPAGEPRSSMEMSITNKPADEISTHPVSIVSTSRSQTPSQTVSPTILSQIPPQRSVPTAIHKVATGGINRRWTSTPRFRGTNSYYSKRPGQSSARVGQVPRPESNSNISSNTCTCRNATNYPYPEEVDLLHLICQGLIEEAAVWKTFILNQQLLKLQVIKDAFGLESVEMKIRDNWVVLTDDANGYVPLRFSPNTSHTIKGTQRIPSLDN